MYDHNTSQEKILVCRLDVFCELQYRSCVTSRASARASHFCVMHVFVCSFAGTYTSLRERDIEYNTVWVPATALLDYNLLYYGLLVVTRPELITCTLYM